MQTQLCDALQWNEILNEQDMVQFLEKISYFHDSCMKEIRYCSGSFVNDNLRMHPINDVRKLFVVFQCQSKQLPMVEMEFSGLKYLRLYPIDNGYSSEILCATMLINDGEVYWCDYDEIDIDEFDKYNGTAIRAEKCRWRIISGEMGAAMFYKSKYDKE